ncbi:hypothetical protein LJ657_42575 [Streptomyces sp. NR30]|uniref:Uncharacterized protein n=2 Tax=Streptomyces guryensis TaxID=2886947 RepID=A0A9Q3VX24_9ACTN|nr:hypothetical protein [Streptomyces guryensis]MCD9880134.1 hypothetical protein [Streptomyces guryensis]
MKPLLPSQPSTTTDEQPRRGAPPWTNDLAPLLAAWDLADPAAHPALADPEWRHLLDEIAHPRTTQGFHCPAAAA